MKKMRLLCVSLSIILLFSGCSAADLPEKAEEEQGAVTETAVVAEPDMSVAELLLSPDFLNNEQREVYEKAMEIYRDYFAFGLGGPVSGEWEPVTINDMMYNRMAGEFSLWADFTAALQSVFTEEWIANELDGIGYVEREGYTYFVPADRGADIFYVGPDLFSLVAETENSLLFNIIGQYDYDDGNGIVQDVYPVELVRTAAGWRVNQISVTE